MLTDFHSHFRALAFLAILLIVGGLFGCDSIQTGEEDKPVNPYKDITDNHLMAASFALSYAQNQAPTTNKDKVRKNLSEGYQRYIRRDESRAHEMTTRIQELSNTFEAVGKRIAQSPNVKSAHTLSLDSLLAIAALTSAQKTRFKKLMAITKQTDSLEKLVTRLNEFDAETNRKLDKSSRKVILQFSALLRAQIQFLETLDPSDAHTLISSSDSSLQKGPPHSSKTTGKRDCPAGPRPQSEHYFNAPDLAKASFWGLINGMSAGANCAWTGLPPVTYVCIGAGGLGGMFANTTWEYASQMEEWKNDLKAWCAAPGCNHSVCNGIYQI